MNKLPEHLRMSESSEKQLSDPSKFQRDRIIKEIKSVEINAITLRRLVLIQYFYHSIHSLTNMVSGQEGSVLHFFVIVEVNVCSYDKCGEFSL